MKKNSMIKQNVLILYWGNQKNSYGNKTKKKIGWKTIGLTLREKYSLRLKCSMSVSCLFGTEEATFKQNLTCVLY